MHIDAAEVERILTFHHLREELPRKYLGMSSIGQCPREQYWNYVNREPRQPRMAWYSMVGEALETAIVERLGAEQVRRDVVAEFDDWFRGHTDHEMGNTLIEIKTASFSKYSRLFRSGEPFQPNVDQCQMYMRHGKFDHAVLIYTPRDIAHKRWEENPDIPPLPFWVLDVPPDKLRQDYLD